MNTKMLHLAIIASGCVAALPAYAVAAITHPISRPEVVQRDFKLIWEHHDQYRRSDFMNSPDVKSKPDFMTNDRIVAEESNPAAAPEIDPVMAAGALTLLAGGLVVLGGGRRRSA